MATVNLGAIKFNWKGAYSNSTAYAVDDVVSSGGSSYVCIQAHTNQPVGNATAYWNIMSSAGTNGTNGTDVGTVITTQGDILYRDGSGLQRLPKGTAGQVLKMNSGATAPEYGTAPSGKVLQYVSNHDNTEVAVNAGTTPNFAMGNRLDLAITPSATSSRILVMYNFGTISSGAAGCIGYGVIKVSNDGFSSNETVALAQGANQVTNNYSHFGINLNEQTYQTNQGLCCSFIHHPNSTSTQTYRPKFWTESSGGYIYINRSERNSSNDFSSVCFAYAMELEG